MNTVPEKTTLFYIKMLPCGQCTTEEIGIGDIDEFTEQQAANVAFDGQSLPDETEYDYILELSPVAGRSKTYSYKRICRDIEERADELQFERDDEVAERRHMLAWRL